ncbi:hypothetical protein B0H16DRAFT_1885754 [Mycena metata]|uniref:F-box domain-containing protein n=1 Tax=Mycena metata TaxID=1033252 RepID=A0AAD7NF00_9AGAR|nr:hypothetical protein B0H16DRAFT_1885754 [Mycena metata]
MASASNSWALSLRSGPPSQKPTDAPRRPLAPANVGRRASTLVATAGGIKPGNSKPSKISPKGRENEVKAVGIPRKSTRTKNSEAAIEPREKCTKACCTDYAALAQDLERGYKTALAILRAGRKVRPRETTRVLADMSRYQIQHHSYEQKLLWLKPTLKECRPGRLVSAATAPQSCIHPCCDRLRSAGAREVARLYGVIQQFQSQTFLQYLDAVRGLVSPIGRLPPELVRVMFAFVVKNELVGLDALPLVHVCSLWRSVALDMSQLWATIDLTKDISDERRLAQLRFYVSHAKERPLSIQSNWPSQPLLAEIIHLSHRWGELFLDLNRPEELDAVRGKIPLLKSLFLHFWHDDTDDTDELEGKTFEDAPSLRHLALTGDYGRVRPSRFILPWHQITELTLDDILPSEFSEFLSECPRLLSFEAYMIAGDVPHMAELCRPLRKLILQGWVPQEAVIAHTFPHMLSLSLQIDLENGLHPEFFAFLARSSRLEMLTLPAWPLSITTVDVVALLLATPSLRIMRSHWALVTPRFDLPLLPLTQDDVFEPPEPQSFAELHASGGIKSFPIQELRAIIRKRTENFPSLFDEDGIAIARLETWKDPGES